MRTLFIALRAVVFASAFVLLWGWLALRLRTLDRSVGLMLPARTAMPGIIVIMVGGILALTCIGMFVGRGRGTPAILMLHACLSPWVPTGTFAIPCTLEVG